VNGDQILSSEGMGGFVESAFFEKRARAVVEYLVKKGISSDRLTAAGYGFSRPAATNTTVAGRAMNRRVELKPIY